MPKCTTRVSDGFVLVSRFCTGNCRPMSSNYQHSHLRSDRDLHTDSRGGRCECDPFDAVDSVNIVKPSLTYCKLYPEW